MQTTGDNLVQALLSKWPRRHAVRNAGTRYNN
jgi:hypothetical protein